MSGSTGQIIAFNQIPMVWEVPGNYTEIAPSYNQAGAFAWPARALLIGNMLSGGTAVAGTAYPIYRKPDATTLFGAGSQLEAMAWAWLDGNAGAGIPLDAIGLADAGGAAKAAGTFTVAGSGWQAATPAIQVGAARYQVGVLSADTPTTVAAAFVAAIQADPQCPCTVANAAGVLTVTAKNAGIFGNDINISVSPSFGDVLPAGMTIATSAATLAGGATNPSVAGPIAAISGNWYTSIVSGYQDATNLALIGAELNRRQNAMIKQDALGFAALTGTLSQQLAKAAAVDCPFLCVPGITVPQSAPWQIAACLQGVADRELTADPSRQLRGMVLPGILGSRPLDRRIPSEEQQMLVGGVATLRTNRQNAVTVEKLVSCYTTNASGTLDPAYHEIHEAAVASRMRHDWNTYLSLTYPRAKLAPDDSIAAQRDPTVATPRRLKASWAFRMSIWEGLGWVESGQENARKAVFAIDGGVRGRINATLPYRRLGNLYVFAGQFQFQV
jgi:phage tail sheath gpL-like